MVLLVSQFLYYICCCLLLQVVSNTHGPFHSLCIRETVPSCHTAFRNNMLIVRDNLNTHLRLICLLFVKILATKITVHF